MTWDFNQYEDQPTDELVYGRCVVCYQIDELNADGQCLVCEGNELKDSTDFKQQYSEHYE